MRAKLREAHDEKRAAQLVRLLEPLVADPSAPLMRVHPLARIAAALVVMLGLFITVDVVTSGVVLIAVVAAIALSGLTLSAVARRAAPLIASAIALGAINALLGTSGVMGGVAIAMRLLGISLAGIAAIASVDPTELADALVQHLRAPSRFVVGALAAVRLFPIFSGEWDTIGLARRARGIEADRDAAHRLAAFPGRALTLLVGAIRRATRLALAMDARGFGSRDCRTLARPRPLAAGDAIFVASAALTVGAATAASVALGTWRPLLTF